VVPLVVAVQRRQVCQYAPVGGAATISGCSSSHLDRQAGGEACGQRKIRGAAGWAEPAQPNTSGWQGTVADLLGFVPQPNLRALPKRPALAMAEAILFPLSGAFRDGFGKYGVGLL